MSIYSAFVGKETFRTLKTNQKKHSPKIMFLRKLRFNKANWKSALALWDPAA